MTSRFYDTDPQNPDAPEVLAEYNGLKPGMRVLYQNPAWRQPDGTYKTGGMDPPLIVTEILRFGAADPDFHAFVEAVINDGEWQCNADNLVPEENS